MAASDNIGSQFDDYMQPHWDEHGQGMLFSPEVGTGLHTDPISRKRRMELASTISGYDRGYDDPMERIEVIRNIDTSKIPLAHLRMVSDSGIKVRKMRNNENSTAVGRINYSIYVDDSGNSTLKGGVIDIGNNFNDRFNNLKPTLTHEIGHAVHIIQNPAAIVAGSSKTKQGYSGYAEGIADGYADKYSGHYLSRPASGLTPSAYPEAFRSNEQAMKEKRNSFNNKYKDLNKSEIFDQVTTDLKRESIENNALYQAMRKHVGGGGDIPTVTEATAIRGLGLRPNKRARGKQRRLPGVDW